MHKLNKTQFAIYKSLVESIFHDRFEMAPNEIPWTFDQLTKGVMVALRYGVTECGYRHLQQIVKEHERFSIPYNGTLLPFDHVVEVIAERLQHQHRGL